MASTDTTAAYRLRQTDPRIGQLAAGRYRIERLLARGGMGRVYFGQHVELEMPVAIKVLEPSDDETTNVGRFEREARTIAHLNNPHIVRPLDWGKLSCGSRFLVMNLVPGRDLGMILEDTCPLHPARALRILKQVACGLDHAHSEGIVHRDLKPENIMIDESADDFVTILDFGIARDLHAKASFSSTGEIIGTPEYMAPEQACGDVKSIGPATDLYSLAAIALELISGSLPYPRSSPLFVVRMILTSPPRWPSELGLDVPGLDAIFERAFSRQPQERYPNAQAFMEALEDALQDMLAEAGEEECSTVASTEELAESGETRLSGESATPLRPLRLDETGARALGPSPSGPIVRDRRVTGRVGLGIAIASIALVASALAAGWASNFMVAGF